MAFQTWELWEMAIDAVGVEVLAKRNGVGSTTVYRWARPPMHEDPDGTGAPSRLDHIEATVEAFALREKGRPSLRIWRLWFDQLFARILDNVHPRPASVEELRSNLPRLLREFADVVDAVGSDDACAQRITREWMELVEVGDQLVSRLQAGIATEAGTRPKIRSA